MIIEMTHWLHPVGAIHFLVVSGLVFVIGITGFCLNRKNFLSLLMCLELILLSISLNFVVFSSFWKHVTGQVFSLFILTVAAAESAVGLAILVVYFRLKSNISITNSESILD